jgi:hypothetical protein
VTAYADSYKLPGGLRVFTSTEGDVVFADQSGSVPEDTDDGPVCPIFDSDLHVVSETVGGYYREVVFVPCLDKGGQPTQVVVGFADALILASKYDFGIRAGRYTFHVAPNSFLGTFPTEPKGARPMRITKTTTEVYE